MHSASWDYHVSERSPFHYFSSNSIKIAVGHMGEDFTHALKNFGLGMLNLWTTYYIERCYLIVFSMLYECKIVEASIIKTISLSSSHILFCFVNKFWEMVMFFA